jgi:hypothetical protein
MARRVTPLKARRAFKGRLLLGLVLRPLRLFCEHCDKYVPSDMEWRCGYCNEENWFTRYYSFLNKCRKCKRPAKSFVCPHCREINFLDKDQVETHPATKAGPSVLPPTKDEARREKREEREDSKEELNHEIEIARLSADLVKYKASAEFAKAKTAMEKLEKSFGEHDAHVMGVKTIVRRQKALNFEKYKDDPEGLEDATDSLESWAESEKK